nr:hypothetical protein [Angustibacter aerolatus]
MRHPEDAPRGHHRRSRPRRAAGHQAPRRRQVHRPARRTLAPRPAVHRLARAAGTDRSRGRPPDAVADGRADRGRRPGRAGVAAQRHELQEAVDVGAQSRRRAHARCRTALPAVGRPARRAGRGRRRPAAGPGRLSHRPYARRAC